MTVRHRALASRSRTCWPILTAVLCATVLTFASQNRVGAQIVPPESAAGETVTELGPLTALYLGVAVTSAVRVSDEIFEGMGPGFGVGVSVAGDFDAGPLVGVRGVRRTYRDDLGDERAQTTDLELEMLWILGSLTKRLEAGPVVGYSWLSREIYSRTAGGMVAGIVVRGRHSMSQSLSLLLGASATWSVFASPPLTPPPPDPDMRALGQRLSISIGLERRRSTSPR